MTVLRSVGYGILGIATACATGANKITHTVCGKGVIIIRKISLVGTTSDYLAVHNSTQSTKARASLGDFTLMKAYLAGNSVHRPGGIFWKTVGFSGTGVNLLDLRPNFIKVGSDTLYTEAYCV